MTKRTTLILTLAAAAAVLIAPSAATAKPGFLLPQTRGEDNGRVFKSRATHCGPTEFGTYKFRNSVKSKRWSGYVVYKASLLQPGPGQAFGGTAIPKFLRFGGNLPKGMKKRTRTLLDSVLFRLKAGPPPIVESIFADGSLQASRPFNPVPTNNC